ncbi:MAG TPA: 30S ribosome-binding factor RbfA [Dysgonamonadaceae bacterium]|jgi:ribosome-binding factor A|nr:30S ribosome-binding factor RbfA [Dysgonamonadaceae bacterium]
MKTNREEKINRLVQKELSELFLTETKKTRGVIISVTHVRISPDLSVAHVYLSIFPSEKAHELLKNITDNVKTIRYDLGTRIGKQVRIVPELIFHLDDSLDYIDNIDRLLKNA